MHILHLKNTPIFKQLQIEEALLRLDTRNFCIINEGSSPAIVMGISGNRSELIDEHKLSKMPIPVIKRFSGGGTVVVDENTLFVSFLCQAALHDFSPYPEPIMRWTEEIYKETFQLSDFSLKENDYVIGNRKCGGNAQYLRKGRWIHHTTFLWDYQQKHMNLLLHPKKSPDYRQARSHDAFLTRLCDHLPSKEQFIKDLKRTLTKRYPTQDVSLGELTSFLEEPHRQNTQMLSQTSSIQREGVSLPKRLVD